jgi:hypothetical protein
MLLETLGDHTLRQCNCICEFPIPRFHERQHKGGGDYAKILGYAVAALALDTIGIGLIFGIWFCHSAPAPKGPLTLSLPFPRPPEP